MCLVGVVRISFRKLSRKGGGGGGGDNWRGIWILRGGGMMVKGVTKFYKPHLGWSGMLECVCVCVCKVSYRILSFRSGTPKFGVDVARVYSTKQLGGSGGMILQI